MYTNEAADYETLTNFNSIDACVDVDCVGAKNGKTSHVNIVKESEVDRVHTDQIS